MSLKSLINRQKIAQKYGLTGAAVVLTLPGEPTIYSIKYSLRDRRLTVQFLRSCQWRSVLKSYFRSFMFKNQAVAVIVRFYVSPPEEEREAKKYRKDNCPAVYSYEICDYLLSFLEMLHHVLINSYRQIVKVDAEKFYSKDPRTEMQFMLWSEYEKLSNQNPVHAKSKGKRQNHDGGQGCVQPECEGDAALEILCEGGNST